MNLPNKITVARIGLTGLFVMALLLPAEGMIRTYFALGKTTALIIFIIASLTDWWDGWYARRYNLETSFGALMDPLADKLLVTAAFICFIEQPSYRANVPLVQGWMVLVIVSREFLVTGLRLVAKDKGVVLRAEQLGKHKTISQMVTIIVTLAGLAAREDWQCLGYEVREFDVVFCRLVFGMMLATVALTVWSGVAYFYKNGKLFLEDA